MDILTGLDRVFIMIFLISSMLGLGMQTTTAELRDLFASRVFLIRMLVVNFLIVPVAGIILVKSMTLAPETAMAILLFACWPGGVSALQFTTKIKGTAAYAGSSAGILFVLSLLISPLLLFAAHPRITFVIPYGRALFLIVLLVLGPFAAGVWAQKKREEEARKLSKFFVVAGTLAFVALVALQAGLRKQSMAMVEKADFFPMIVLILFAMAAGWFAGGTRKARAILAIMTSMRNAALCLMIAEQTFPGHNVQAPLIVFTALMVPMNLLLTLYVVLRLRKSGKSAI